MSQILVTKAGHKLYILCLWNHIHTWPWSFVCRHVFNDHHECAVLTFIIGFLWVLVKKALMKEKKRNTIWPWQQTINSVFPHFEFPIFVKVMSILGKWIMLERRYDCMPFPHILNIENLFTQKACEVWMKYEMRPD